MVRKVEIAIFTLCAGVLLPDTGEAAGVTLTGSVINICVLTLATPGTLTLSTDGTQLASTDPGGLSATLNVVATGSTPTINWSAPTLSSTGGSTSG